MLLSGTASLLDLLRQDTGLAISFDPQPAGYHQGVLGPRIFEHAHVPQSPNPELLERSPVEAHKIVGGLGAHRIRVLAREPSERQRPADTATSLSLTAESPRRAPAPFPQSY